MRSGTVFAQVMPLFQAEIGGEIQSTQSACLDRYLFGQVDADKVGMCCKLPILCAYRKN
jgi:hypothetical protein